MSLQDLHTLAMQPWMKLLAACEAEHADPAAPGNARPRALLARARRVLTGLASGREAPVPAWVEAAETVLDAEGRVRDLRPARTLREMACDRDAVLRLGIWGALDALARTPAAQDAAAAPNDHFRPFHDFDAFDHLIVHLSRGPEALPPGLRPSRRHGRSAGGFAASPDAAEFFNHRLRKTLANLAALYDARGADFARWLRLPDYTPDPTPECRESWSQAWTVVAVATYLDWLKRTSGGSLARALALVWAEQPKRFRPPPPLVRQPDAAAPGAPRPAVLPTDDDRMHFELLTGIVLAQLMEYDAQRWQALQQGDRSFAVALSMKGLDQADSRLHDRHLQAQRNHTFYRGLTILQIYMAAGVERLQALPATSPAGGWA
jgi:hypothetical protein